MEGIGQRLKALRQALGIKQGDFAQKIGLKQGSFSDIENGKEILTTRNMKLIIHEFGVNEAWLGTGEGEMFAHRPDMLENDEHKLLEMFKRLLPETKKAVLKIVADLLAATNAAQGKPPDEVREAPPDYGQAAGAKKARKGA